MSKSSSTKVALLIALMAMSVPSFAVTIRLMNLVTRPHVWPPSTMLRGENLIRVEYQPAG